MGSQIKDILFAVLKLHNRVVVLCRRLSDNSLVIIKEIPVEEMTTEERQAALNEVKVYV